MLLLWIVVFLVSLVALVKGADWLVISAERIGLALGLSPFIVGVTIVGVGTSLPELIASIAAVLKDVTDIVVADVVGSNIVNILLIIGIAVIVARRIVVTKSLIDLDLPLLAISTVLFIAVAADRRVSFVEAIFLLVMYVVYVMYSVLHKDEEHEERIKRLPGRPERRKHLTFPLFRAFKKPDIAAKDLWLLVLGIAGLAVGAHYLIESVVQLSEILAIGTGAIALVAVAAGTSTPELIVSAKAAYQRKSEIAIGNIFGSNVFNMLVVVGIPAVMKDLEIDAATFSLGLPMLAATTLLFIISGISRTIYLWEGAMYVILYIFFVGKLYGFF